MHTLVALVLATNLTQLFTEKEHPHVFPTYAHIPYYMSCVPKDAIQVENDNMPPTWHLKKIESTDPKDKTYYYLAKFLPGQAYPKRKTNIQSSSGSGHSVFYKTEWEVRGTFILCGHRPIYQQLEKEDISNACAQSDRNYEAPLCGMCDKRDGTYYQASYETKKKITNTLCPIGFLDKIEELGCQELKGVLTYEVWSGKITEDIEFEEKKAGRCTWN